MNENIDLTKILKDCPKGFELYSPLCGTILFIEIRNGAHGFEYPVICCNHKAEIISFTKEGYFYSDCLGSKCILYPSKDQRDWSKFTAPWYKKEKFDPKTLKSYDMVLVRDFCSDKWKCSIFSHIEPERIFPYVCIYLNWKFCIPYNDDTKHLVGTTDEAPEYYKYWDD